MTAAGDSAARPEIFTPSLRAAVFLFGELRSVSVRGGASEFFRKSAAF